MYIRTQRALAVGVSVAIFSYDLSKPVDIVIHSNNEEEIRKFNEVMEEFK